MKQETSMNIRRIVASVLVFLLLVGVIGLIFALTDGFTENFKQFYLTCGDEKIMTQEDKRELKPGETYTFGVKYVFDAGVTKSKDFSVKIVSNAEKTFSYTVDDQLHPFKDGDDYSSEFGLKKDKDAFTFIIPQGGLTEVISAHFSGKKVEIANPSLLKDGYFFSIVVTSYNKKATLTVKFKFLANVTGVEFVQDDLVF